MYMKSVQNIYVFNSWLTIKALNVYAEYSEQTEFLWVSSCKRGFKPSQSPPHVFDLVFQRLAEPGHNESKSILEMHSYFHASEISWGILKY